MSSIKRIKPGIINKKDFYSPQQAEPSVYGINKSIKLECPETGKALKIKYKKIIEAIEQWADHKDYAIGHIKLYIDSDNENLWAASTGCGVNVQSSPLFMEKEYQCYNVVMTVIVLGVSNTELKEAIQNLITNLPVKNQ